MKTGSSSKKHTKKYPLFGMELILNVYDCSLEVISSAKKLKEYAQTLCKVIDMIPYGKPLVPYFGEKELHTKGYSLVQLIETSSITGHFSEYYKTAYINIFSCKDFDPKKAAEFTKEFFQAKKVTKKFVIR